MARCQASTCELPFTSTRRFRASGAVHGAIHSMRADRTVNFTPKEHTKARPLCFRHAPKKRSNSKLLRPYPNSSVMFCSKRPLCAAGFPVARFLTQRYALSSLAARCQQILCSKSHHEMNQGALSKNGCAQLECDVVLSIRVHERHRRTYFGDPIFLSNACPLRTVQSSAIQNVRLGK